MENVQSFTRRHLQKMAFADDDEKNLYILLVASNCFAGITHLFLLGMYFFLGIHAMAYVNIGSVAIYAALFVFQLKKHNYALTGFALTAEVIAHILLCAVFTGTGDFSSTPIIVTLVMQLSIPYTSTKNRVIVGALLWVTLMAAFAINTYTEPMYDVGYGYGVRAATYLNITFIGTIIQLFAVHFVKWLIKNVNDQKMSELLHQAYTDTLTGLYNRRYADVLFSQPKIDGTPSSIAIIDIDLFKNINDTYGHLSGDILLMHAADLLRRSFRKTDILFRWGGDEFLIVLTGVNSNTAYTLLEKFRELVYATPAIANDQAIGFTVTVGVADLDYSNIKKSIEKSDEMLYIGKERGRNTVVCSEIETGR